MLIEVKAKNMRAGDVLCTDQSQDLVWWESTMNAWKIQSRAYFAVLENPANRNDFWQAHETFRRHSQHIEHVSYGPFRARILFPSGVVIRVPKNMDVAVWREGID